MGNEVLGKHGRAALAQAIEETKTRISHLQRQAEGLARAIEEQQIRLSVYEEVQRDLVDETTAPQQEEPDAG